jgi:DNA-binding NarL/FixJ family response regulator
MPKRASKTITVLIADDEPVARAGIRALLDKAQDIQIIGEAQDGSEVKELIPKLRPQILLLDLKMPGPRPSEIEKWVRENYPEIVTLILTSHDRDAYLATMMNAGAAGYLTKEESAERLIGAIRRAAEGAIYFSDEQIARARKWKETVKEKWESLTNREREILQRLVIGEDNKAIAKSLNITLKTVEFHMTNILKKLNRNSRDEVIIWMLEHHPDTSNNIKD